MVITQENPLAGSNSGHDNTSFDYSSNTSAQQQRLIQALQDSSLGITTIYARKVLDVMHPAGRIQELRDRGYRIDTLWDIATTDAGEEHRVARYVLISSPAKGGK